MLYIDGMNDEAGIRRANLNRLVKDRKLGPTALSRAYEKSPSPPYWSDLRRGKRDFGEKAARAIEAGLGLPRGWLDQEGALLPKPGKAAPAQETPHGHSHFATLAAERIDEIPDEERREAAYYLLIQMLDFGAEVTHAPVKAERTAAEGPAPQAGGASVRGASMPKQMQLPGQ